MEKGFTIVNEQSRTKEGNSGSKSYPAMNEEAAEHAIAQKDDPINWALRVLTRDPEWLKGPTGPAYRNE